MPKRKRSKEEIIKKYKAKLRRLEKQKYGDSSLDSESEEECEIICSGMA